MRRQSVIQIANELIKKVPLDTIRGVIPEIRGMWKEREYRKMEKLGSKFSIPIPGMFLRRQIFLDGEEIFDSGRQRSNTTNRNHFNMMFCQAAAKDGDDTGSFGTAFLSIKDTSGNIRAGNDAITLHTTLSYDIRDASRGLLATAGSVLNGIVVGTGNAAEDFEGFALDTLILNGSDSGPPRQFDYSQSELHAVTESALTLKDTLIRDTNNNSGGAETGEETGIYIGVWVGGAQRQVMMTRDLTGGDVIPDAAQYRTTYEITLLYPS